MELEFLLKGLVLGFSIAAPVGPIGMLCIRRTLLHGRLTGFFTGLGTATADSFYGLVAGLGLAVVSSALVEQQVALRLVGGAFLLYLGVRAFFEAPAHEAANKPAPGVLGAYLSSLLLTVTNPATIFSFAAVFAGLGLVGQAGDLASAGSLVAGVFVGSAAWWFILSGAVSMLGRRLRPEYLAWVNRVSGVTISGFGAAALMSVFTVA